MNSSVNGRSKIADARLPANKIAADLELAEARQLGGDRGPLGE